MASGWNWISPRICVVDDDPWPADVDVAGHRERRLPRRRPDEQGALGSRRQRPREGRRVDDLRDVQRPRDRVRDLESNTLAGAELDLRAKRVVTEPVWASPGLPALRKLERCRGVHSVDPRRRERFVDEERHLADMALPGQADLGVTSDRRRMEASGLSRDVRRRVDELRVRDGLWFRGGLPRRGRARGGSFLSTRCSAPDSGRPRDHEPGADEPDQQPRIPNAHLNSPASMRSDSRPVGGNRR